MTESTAPLSPQGQADRAWLQEKLGDRFRGPYLREGHGEWEIELVKLTGLKSWAFGRTPEDALARARDAVEGATRNRRIS
jgi:hypothetical protein